MADYNPNEFWPPTWEDLKERIKELESEVERLSGVRTYVVTTQRVTRVKAKTPQEAGKKVVLRLDEVVTEITQID